jgi:hypothetical protein
VWGVKLTIQFQFVSKLRRCGAVTSHPFISYLQQTVIKMIESSFPKRNQFLHNYLVPLARATSWLPSLLESVQFSTGINFSLVLTYCMCVIQKMNVTTHTRARTHTHTHTNTQVFRTLSGKESLQILIRISVSRIHVSWH